jgi:hypothetical protein
VVFGSCGSSSAIFHLPFELNMMLPVAQAVTAEEKEMLLGLPPPVPKELICPITQELMVDPVFAEDGFSYERVKKQKQNILPFLQKHFIYRRKKKRISFSCV